MDKLSSHQLFTLMFIFEVGSTTIFAIGIGANQDAWLVILIAMLIGLIFMWIYTEIQKNFPNSNYIEIVKLVLGNKIGGVVAILYILNLLWHLARNVREFGELVIITLLPDTPIIVILFLFILSSVYIIIKGINSIGRLSEIVFFIILFFMLGIFLLTYVSGIINTENLLPVLGDGVKPLLKELPGVIVFPFGEISVFLMYWKYAIEKNKLRAIGMKVIFYSGILLCVSVMLDICVLGAGYTAIATIPLVESIKLINIENIISNIDAIGVLIMFLGGFFKMTIYLNAINMIITSIFKTKNSILTLILFSSFLLWFSIIFEPNYAYHKWLVPFDTSYFNIIYSNAIPLIVFVIFLMKRKRMKFK